MCICSAAGRLNAQMLCDCICVFADCVSSEWRFFFCSPLMASLAGLLRWKPGCHGNTACLHELQVFHSPSPPLYLPLSVTLSLSLCPFSPFSALFFPLPPLVVFLTCHSLDLTDQRLEHACARVRVCLCVRAGRGWKNNFKGVDKDLKEQLKDKRYWTQGHRSVLILLDRCSTSCVSSSPYTH